MALPNLLDGLDNEQKQAVTLTVNGVITAGAGSGKTKVLASRYAWLIMEQGRRPEEILTLTFTNKAVSEMYSRIYQYLLDQSGESERAARALAEFHKAKISTLDSFSAGIARTAAARYGLSPEFTSDDGALRNRARERALQFILDNREAPALRQLLPDHKIKDIAKDIFARVVLAYSPLSSPPDYDAFLDRQKTFIRKAWKENSGVMNETAVRIRDAVLALEKSGKKSNFITALAKVFAGSPVPPRPPDIAALLEHGGSWAEEALPEARETRRELKNYFDFYANLVSVSLQGQGRPGKDTIETVENFRGIKGSQDEDGLYQITESIANYCLNFGLCAGVYGLLKQFQDEFNSAKRQSGMVSFNDIARLALDALRDHPDIRKAYRDSFRMIMIDEFQDNNGLQRDLIYLLAGKEGHTEKGIPLPAELEPDRMFFVGDEKQSIYRFRGADVAVFRTLGKDMRSTNRSGSPEGNISLIHNYRSQPGLIAAFNRIFSQVFLSSESQAAFSGGIPDYEAVYEPILPPENSGQDGEIQPLVSFCFLNGNELPKDDTSGISSRDLEAVFIAKKIRTMVKTKVKIAKRKDGKVVREACAWKDFAVLERSYTHQSSLEKYFREFGVPYNTDRPSGLFNDAPILDIRSYLRLLVYPGDSIAYAALIRSPFMRLSDICLTVCMLNKEAGPFSEENDNLIPEEERKLYCLARERYNALREASKTLSITELIERLWFEEGYRYETLWTESAQVYESLFDLFFSLASDAQTRGLNLAEFIEYLDDVMNREEKPDDKDIPGEGEAGVRIMSIHKAKGLEFPVVFVFDAANAGNLKASQGLVNYHEQFGFILKIPPAEEVSFGGNYFLKIIQEEERLKDMAELRRLLYVAMTRAESLLFVTASLKEQNEEERKKLDIEGEKLSEDTLRLRLEQLESKTGKSNKSRDTFLKLLLPALVSGPSPLWNLEVIPVLSKGEISALASGREAGQEPIRGASPPVIRQQQTVLEARRYYDDAEILLPGKAGRSSLDASGLRYRDLDDAGQAGRDSSPDSGFSPLDNLLEKAGLSAAEFGSLVHSVLEATLNEQQPRIPGALLARVDNKRALAGLLTEAKKMAGAFLDSDIGKRWKDSKNREAEFSVITSAAAGGKIAAIKGKIDLVFEEDCAVVVVDFKTDRTENPPDHYGQLASYFRAAGDIFGKPPQVWLYYLRSGRAFNVTDDIKALPFEEMVLKAIESREKESP